MMTTLMHFAIVLLVILMLACSWRARRGPRTADRLIAIDLIATLLAGVMVILALLYEQEMFLDVALALGALSFIGTIAISRFVAEGSVF
ncbi:cation:proton antiporter [Anaerolineae bacterium CFX9]|jgi:multicomponent Na+:H+ antiporter subunit F|nr:monovalent cation/H+ antiporter complex subunit F [Geitlerinema splendidum]MDK3161423.1 monovalent cation/H+ antiporter complex subunit F [Kamptonema cortianum]MDL1900506.1 cation:proton antiporter [Anaerolineae bacterium CFX9]